MSKEVDEKLQRVINLAVKTGHLYCSEDIYDQLKVYEERFGNLGVKLEINKYLPNGSITAADFMAWKFI